MLRIAFVGTHYHGWQIQPDLPTVQGTLKEAIERIVSERVKLVGCCRTDAGVHAKDYVANFFSKRRVKEENLLMGLNSTLPKDIGVYEVKEVSEDFNSRFSVKRKVYIYRVWNSKLRDPFMYPFSWQVPLEMDISIMKKALDLLNGPNDFSGFAKLEEEKNTLIELRTDLSVEGNLVKLRFEASHFLRYMVRRITGAVVRAACGKLSIEELNDFLKGRHCPFTAPPQGLSLEKVIL